jgi:hypothetical protein
MLCSNQLPPYDIYFRSKSIIWPTLISRMDKTVFEATTLSVGVCVRACLCMWCVHVPQFKVFNHLTEKKIWCKRYARGEHQNLAVINPLQSMEKNGGSASLNIIININF